MDDSALRRFSLFAKGYPDPDICWEWTGKQDHKGYGSFWLEGKTVPAHRVSYEHFVGPIPKGMCIDHIKCDHPPCVNYDHLKPATIKENVLRGKGITANHARRTHCEECGTELTPYITRAGKYYYRRCAPCAKRKARERAAKTRLANRSGTRSAPAAPVPWEVSPMGQSLLAGTLQDQRTPVVFVS